MATVVDRYIVSGLATGTGDGSSEVNAWASFADADAGLSLEYPDGLVLADVQVNLYCLNPNTVVDPSSTRLTPLSDSTRYVALIQSGTVPYVFSPADNAAVSLRGSDTAGSYFTVTGNGMMLFSRGFSESPDSPRATIKTRHSSLKVDGVIFAATSFNTGDGLASGIEHKSFSNSVLEVNNSVFVGFGGNAKGYGIHDNQGTVRSRNNTYIDCGTAIISGGGVSSRNDIFQGNDVDVLGAADVDYRLTDAITSMGQNDILTTTLAFTDPASNDYSLADTETIAASGVGPSVDATVPVTDATGGLRGGPTTTMGAHLLTEAVSIKSYPSEVRATESFVIRVGFETPNPAIAATIGDRALEIISTVVVSAGVYDVELQANLLTALQFSEDGYPLVVSDGTGYFAETVNVPYRPKTGFVAVSLTAPNTVDPNSLLVPYSGAEPAVGYQLVHKDYPGFVVEGNGHWTYAPKPTASVVVPRYFISPTGAVGLQEDYVISIYAMADALPGLINISKFTLNGLAQAIQGSLGNAVRATWYLLADYFISARMPMHLVYPRPDTETQTHSRHRWAHPDMEYRIPIGVQGGAWTFQYELVSPIAGASIGMHHGDANYGIFTWTPQAGQTGTHYFTVRVTDQMQNVVEVIWSVTVDASMFVFVQDGWTGTKVGTITEPLASLADWYMGDEFDSTYLNKIIVFRGGNYTLVGDTNDNNNVRLTESGKTPSLIGYPGEVPVFDCSSSLLIFGSVYDVFISGIRFENSNQSVESAKFIWAYGDCTRATWWENTFYNHGPGTGGTDNTTAVFISDTGNLKNNILYKGNHHEEFNCPAFSNSSYVDMYFGTHILIEDNVAKNSLTSNGFWAKATSAYVTIRNNTAVDNVSGGGIVVGYGGESTILPHDHEICWNHIRIDPADNGWLALQWANSNSWGGQHYNSYVYRNTFINGNAWIRHVGVENYTTDGNVVVNTLTSRWDTTIMDTTNDNLVGTPSDNIVDSNGLLVGSYRETYLGKAGHEVYSGVGS